MVLWLPISTTLVSNANYSFMKKVSNAKVVPSIYLLSLPRLHAFPFPTIVACWSRKNLHAHLFLSHPIQHEPLILAILIVIPTLSQIINISTRPQITRIHSPSTTSQQTTHAVCLYVRSPTIKKREENLVLFRWNGHQFRRQELAKRPRFQLLNLRKPLVQIMLIDCLKMPTTYCYSSSSPGEISISDGEVEGPDYLLSSTVRLDESFFQVLGEFFGY